MQAAVEYVPLLAFLGWPEILGMLAIILILLGARHLPATMRGLGEGMRHFDDAAKEAGKSVGGIYGKPAAEALTPDNQTAELYDPAVFRQKEERNNGQASWLRGLLRRVRRFVSKARGLVRTYLLRVHD